MPQKFEAPSEQQNQVYILRMAEIQRFEAAIEKIRNILRSVAITGMDSMRHCCLYVLSRAITRETAGKLKIPEKFAWENIMHTLHTVDGGDQKVIDLFGNPNQESLVAHFDRLFKTQNFSFDVKSLPKHKEILEILNPLNLKALDSSMDILGWVYEDHLRKGSTSSRDLGQFFTDRKICDYMVALCKPTFKMPGVPESICDPTMGTAGFLSMFIKYFKKIYPDTPVDWNVQQKEVHGCDTDSKVAGLARLNLFLESGGVFQNLVTKDSLNTDLPAMGYDIICANMPFGLKGLKYADSCERVKKLAINTTKSEPLFLQLMMVSLNEGGRCAVVVPDGMLVNNSKGHNATRKYLLDHLELKRVIKMRGSFFTNTGIQPSIMYFVNTGKPTSEVEFWDVEDKGNGTVVEKMMLSVPRSKFDDACSLDMRRYQEIAVVANTGGFPMVKLGDIVDSIPGQSLTPEEQDNNPGPYPVVSGGRIPSKTYFKHNRNANTISVSKFGSYAGFVRWNDTPYWALGSTTLNNKITDSCLDKYLYYYLSENNDKLYKFQREGPTTNFYWSDVIDLKIPLPPLAIQQEIVTALDLIYNNATTAKAAAASVKSQMAAVVRSVGARGFERKKLNEACDISKGRRNLNGKDTGYPYQDVAHVSRLVENYILDGPAVLTPRAMSVGRFVYTDEKCHPSDDMFILKAKDELLPRYLFHYCNLLLVSDIRRSIHGVKPTIDYSAFDVNHIIVPPLPIQHEVLAILNEMEAELATLEQMAAKAEQRAKFILDGYLTPAIPVEAEPVTDPNSIDAFIQQYLTKEDGAEVSINEVVRKYKEWCKSRPEYTQLKLSEFKAALSLVLGDLENDKYKGIKLI